MNRPIDGTEHEAKPFPADAGMNRITGAGYAHTSRPFPADAGMNR